MARAAFTGAYHMLQSGWYVGRDTFSRVQCRNMRRRYVCGHRRSDSNEMERAVIARTRVGFHRFTSGLLIAAGICLAGCLLVVMQAQAGGRHGQPAAQPAQAPHSAAAYAAG